MTILDTYFELSDKYYSDNSALDELINLFNQDAELKLGNGSIIQGQNNIKNFYSDFFAKNNILKHVWSTNQSDTQLETQWGVVGIRKNGDIFSFRGIDIASLNNGKIQSLEIKFL